MVLASRAGRAAAGTAVASASAARRMTVLMCWKQEATESASKGGLASKAPSSGNLHEGCAVIPHCHSNHLSGFSV
jgi:hypothetical protein